MARKANPEMTPLEVEKLLEKKKKKGKSKKDEVEEVSVDIDWERKADSDIEWERKAVSSIGGINLVRPVTRKKVNFETNEKPVEDQDMRPTKPIKKVVKNSARNVPSVILRKPTSYRDDSEDSSRFSFRPNLSLGMMKEQQKDRFSDMTLLKKPEPLNVDAESEGESSHSGDSQANVSDMALLQKPKPLSDGADSESVSSHLDDSQANVSDMTLLKKPEPLSDGAESAYSEGVSSYRGDSQTTVSDMALSKKPEPLNIGADSEGKSSLLGYSKTDVSDMTLSTKPESLNTGVDCENNTSHLSDSEINASSLNTQNVQRGGEPLNPTSTDKSHIKKQNQDYLNLHPLLMLRFWVGQKVFNHYDHEEAQDGGNG